MSELLSKSRVQKAGELIRASQPVIFEDGSMVVGISFEESERFTPEEILDAVQIVQRYRDGHLDAQQTVHVSLAERFLAGGF